MDYQRSQKFLERLEKFSDEVNRLCNLLPKTTINIEIISQLVRAAGSIGANYIEALESFSQKDFYFRIKICRKESRESAFWLKRLSMANSTKVFECSKLATEATEYVMIFSKILTTGNK